MTGGSSFTEHRERGSVHHRGLSVLAICLTTFGLFAVLTGSADVVLGPHLLVANGAALGSSVDDPPRSMSRASSQPFICSATSRRKNSRGDVVIRCRWS